MAVSYIDGTLEQAELKRAPLNLRIYKQLTFRLRDGRERTILKAIVDAKVAALLEPGVSGRFYLFTAPDHRGVHGIRDDQGRAVFAFPRNNERAMLIVSIMGIVLLGATLAMDMLSGWALITIALGVPFYFIFRSTRIAAERQFEGDSGPSSSP
jgi:hypothetical protein